MGRIDPNPAEFGVDDMSPELREEVDEMKSRLLGYYPGAVLTVDYAEDAKGYREDCRIVCAHLDPIGKRDARWVGPIQRPYGE